MRTIINFNKQQTFTQADGNIEVLTPLRDMPSCQVSFNTTSTTGTLAVFAKYHPSAKEEVVFDQDGTTPLVIDLSSVKSFQLYDKWVYSFIFKPTSVDGNYTPCITSGVFIDKL